MRFVPNPRAGLAPRLLLMFFFTLAPGFRGAAAGEKGGGGTEAVGLSLRVARAVRGEVLTPGQCPFDPAAVVLREGLDPEKLERFVRNEIAFEPYPGALRGPEGTLAARSGSDWDRALLLRALLVNAGHEARLRVLDRSAAQCEALVAAFLKGKAHERVLPRVMVPGRPEKPPPPSPLFSRFGIPQRNREIFSALARARTRRLLDESFDASALEAESIGKALASAGQALGQPFEAWRAPLLAGARERVLVEVTDGGSHRILDIGPDPALPARAALKQARTVKQVPAGRIGRLRIRLHFTAEKAGSKREEKVLLDRVLPLGNLFRRPLRLDVVPVGGKSARGKPPGRWSLREWFRAVSRFDQFQAFLYVGGEWSSSMVFDLDGNLHDISSDGRVEAAGKAGALVRRGLGGAFGGRSPVKKKPSGRIDQIVLQIELIIPGWEPIRRSRLVYGRLREEASPVFTAEMLVVPGPVGADTAAWMRLDALTRNIPVLAGFLSMKDPAEFRGVHRAVQFPAMLHDWQLGRLALAARFLALDPVLTVSGGPAVLLKTTQLIPDARSKSVSKQRTIDVVIDGLRLIPRGKEARESAARGNLALGIQSTILESLILRQRYPYLRILGPHRSSEEARLLKLPPAVRLASGASPAGPAAPVALAGWAIERNEGGRALVFPGHGHPATWWSVDPATGATIGRGGGGEGQAAAEYGKVTKMHLDHLKCWLSFQKAVMFGGDTEKAGYDWMACVTGADNPLHYSGCAFSAAGMAGSGMWNDALSVLVGLAKLSGKKR